jgi:hypothetical protein
LDTRGADEGCTLMKVRRRSADIASPGARSLDETQSGDDGPFAAGGFCLQLRQDDGGELLLVGERRRSLAVEVNLFRHTYDTLCPHQALDERTPPAAYLAVEHCD